MKRKYEKPSMTVYELKGKPQILVGSGVPGSDDWLSYGIGGDGIDDENQLA